MTSTLYIEFTLADSTKTATLRLVDPKADVTRTAVEDAASEIIAKNAFKGDNMTKAYESLKTAYIRTVEDNVIVE